MYLQRILPNLGAQKIHVPRLLVEDHGVSIGRKPTTRVFPDGCGPVTMHGPMLGDVTLKRKLGLMAYALVPRAATIEQITIVCQRRAPSLR